MALTEVYVDPSIAADSGTGTVGDPYGDLEYAIEQETFDTTNGTRVNVKAGTAEFLAAQLDTALADTSVSIAWVPTATAPLVFEGYATAAGDGGVGEIDGGGTVSVIDTQLDYIHFNKIKAGNCGANAIIDMDNYCSVISCEVHTTSAQAIGVDVGGVVMDNYLHDCSSTGIDCFDGVVSNNFIRAVGAGGTALVNATDAVMVYRNIVILTGVNTCDGIRLRQSGSAVQNSIFAEAASTGEGITSNTAGQHYGLVMNNLVEGFSGTGGVGIGLGSVAGCTVRGYGANSVYNCETAFVDPAFIVQDFGGNETLTTSPFTDGTSQDLSPVDTGSIKEGGLPQTFPGA